MKQTVLCVTAIILLALITPFLLHAFEGKVVGISDGDTIKVIKDGKQVKIRLAAIDCPEKGQPYPKHNYPSFPCKCDPSLTHSAVRVGGFDRTGDYSYRK